MSKAGEIQQKLASELERSLTERYGEILNTPALARALGYPSTAAFRMAVLRGKIDLQVFEIPNRKGKFALAKDVAAWIAKLRHQKIEESPRTRLDS